ncbi:hypothetical protein HMPREF0539_0295 [Lacticaseibacillus rhamnosus LMS2-1]|uniref:Uncharacterized protein n=1 Tax=Lacticaseibacillus rhamnosus (strain LMS2-1) TaxID=525361 RepID=C2JTR1_LACRM|nr:hypothetical protein HMPREF0539_0295 [Lacticaseibacillus rhamnosus LMS2-1]
MFQNRAIGARLFSGTKKTPVALMKRQVFLLLLAIRTISFICKCYS